MNAANQKRMMRAEASFTEMALQTEGRFDSAHSYVKSLDPLDPAARAAVKRIFDSANPGATLMVEARKLGWKDVLQ